MTASAVRLPRGGECECRSCGVFFSSISAFDAHQRRQGRRQLRQLAEKAPECRSPTETGLVPYERAGGVSWGFPGDPGGFTHRKPARVG